MHGTSIRALWALLCMMPAIGCVLITPPIDHSSATCATLGTNACAECLRRDCQGVIDACCSDRTCSGSEGHSAILDALDECGTGTFASCAGAIAADSSDKSGPIRYCMTQSCKAVCLGDEGLRVNWSCETAPLREVPCAKCVHDACGEALKDCCDDSSCRADSELKKDVGACVGGDAAACYHALSSSSTSLSGVQGMVRGCIRSCSRQCFGSGRSHQLCTLQAAGAYCSCHDAESPEGNECSAEAVGGECVRAWHGCTCGNYGCTAGTLDCSCDFEHGVGDSQECGLPPGDDDGRCCIHVGATTVSCSCDEYGRYRDCNPEKGDYETTSCSYGDVGPRLEQLRVTRCSF